MADDNRWGTVFMGPTANRESRLDKISNREEQDLWNRRTEAEYLRRVKERAVEQLNAMLSEAQEQAAGLLAAAAVDAENIRQAAEALREEARQDRETAAAELENAQNIRAASYDEGYDRGVEQAMLELDEQRAGVDTITLAVLKAIEDQCGTLFASWRAELAALFRQSVETGTAWILDEDRAAILENLLCKSVDMLENQRRISVRANPVDAPAVEEVLNSVRSRFNDLKAWEVKSDDTLAPGGLVVESVSGRVESLAESRREIVEQALRHLTLPESEAEAVAMQEVQAAGEKAGLPVLEQAVFDAEQKAQEREALQAAQQEAAQLAEAAQQAEIAQQEAEEPEESPEGNELEDDGTEFTEQDSPVLDSVPDAPPRPARPTPRNPALAALPEGSSVDDGFSEQGLSPEDEAEYDREAKEIARAMMFGDSAVAQPEPESAQSDEGLQDEDLDTPMSDEELFGDMPDFASMTPEEAEAYAKKLMEQQD